MTATAIYVGRPFAPLGDTRAPKGWAERPEVRANLTDPALPHQIRITCGTVYQAHRLFVSCNCLRALSKPGRGGGPAPTLGYFTTLDEAWALYRTHLLAGEQP
jgi:hypothetical protein